MAEKPLGALDPYAPIYFLKQHFRCISFDENEFIMDFSMEPGGFVPSHYHKYMSERFEITGGEGEFIIGGKKQVPAVGDIIFVEKGIPHSLRTISTIPLTCKVRYSPSSDTDKMFAIFAALSQEGYQGIKLMLKAEYLCRRAGIKEFSRSKGVMNWIEKMIMILLIPIGTLKGWNKWLQQHNWGNSA